MLHATEVKSILLYRLHMTFTYNMPAVGRKRGRTMAATQLAALQVQFHTKRPQFHLVVF